MLKLIDSSMLPPGLVESSIVTDTRDFVKRASAKGSPLFDYEKLTAPKGHVGIHLTAIGDYETYGFNRNGDSFPKEANAKYHNTFVTNGTLFEHHKNKDSKKGLGKVAASAYNDEMKRIELFIHADEDKAAEHLSRLEKTGEVSFSMGAHVPGDRCDICGTFRKSANDPNQCEHVSTGLGKLADDGSYTGVHNDDPTFFDISFVTRPADRIAWSLKTASDGLATSTALAEAENLRIPLHMALNTKESLGKYAFAVKLARMEGEFRAIGANGPTAGDQSFLWNVAKGTCTKVASDETLEELRRYRVEDVLYKLAENKILLDPMSYCKYAMGNDLGSLEPVKDVILAKCATVFTDHADRLEKLCGASIYDVDTRDLSLSLMCDTRVDATAKAMAKTASIATDTTVQRALEFELNGKPLTIVKIGSTVSNDEANRLASVVASKYASYKLAALQAMDTIHGIDDRQLAVAATQHITTKTD